VRGALSALSHCTNRLMAGPAPAINFFAPDQSGSLELLAWTKLETAGGDSEEPGR